MKMNLIFVSYFSLKFAKYVLLHKVEKVNSNFFTYKTNEKNSEFETNKKSDKIEWVTNILYLWFVPHLEFRIKGFFVLQRRES